jgi:drug/metabolite transporter (DMT)-like permease
MTGSGNATMIISMVPAVMPFLAMAFLKERPSAGELVGTALALGGVAFLGIFDFRLSAASFAGDLVCFGSMVIFALYLVSGKRSGSKGELILFLLPLYLIAGFLCLLFALAFAPSPAWSGRDWLMVLGLTLLPTMVGHSVFNWAMRKFPAQLSSLVNLSQFVFATLLALLFFGESPEAQFYPAAAMILAGQAWAIMRRGRGGNPRGRSGGSGGSGPSSPP